MSLHTSGVDVLGASPDALTDKASVQKFQGGVMSLPRDKQEPEFLAMAKAINSETNAFGTFGPTTKKAASKFNAIYCLGEGPVITQATLMALERLTAAPASSPAVAKVMPGDDYVSPQYASAKPFVTPNRAIAASAATAASTCGAAGASWQSTALFVGTILALLVFLFFFVENQNKDAK